NGDVDTNTSAAANSVRPAKSAHDARPARGREIPMRFSRASHCVLISLTMAFAAAPAMAEEATPEQLIDGLNGVFGAHAKMRAAHTTGICVKRNFTPTAEAAALSKSPVFAAPVPLVGRFSLG